MLKVGALIPLLAVAAVAQRGGPEPKVELLWPGGAPGAMGTEEIDKPSIAIYLPRQGARKVRSGVVVCAGGGYGALAMDHEGHQVARWINSLGVAAFVLKYRLGPKYRHPVELGDGASAPKATWHPRRPRISTRGTPPHRIRSTAPQPAGRQPRSRPGEAAVQRTPGDQGDSAHIPVPPVDAPAVAGSILTLLLTGGGVTEPASRDGVAALRVAWRARRRSVCGCRRDCPRETSP
jgi:hypothetical protein